MRKLLISFVFTLLTAQSAYAQADMSKADHAVNLIESFQAPKVDAVINSSIGNFKCGEGLNVAIDNDVDNIAVRGPGRAPSIVAGKSKFALFVADVKKDKFREDFYKEGDIYSYSSETKKKMNITGIDFETSEVEYVFNRKSKNEENPFEHELGLTRAEVKKAILHILNSSEENYQTDEKAFTVRIKDKAYHIDLNMPLLANPVYKQDVNTGNIEYGLGNVTPRKNIYDMPFVSMSE